MPQSQSSRLRTQVLTVVTLVLVPLLLVVSGAAVYFEFKRAQEMEVKVLASYETRSQIQQLFSLLQDAETGHRGFAITGDERYLEPYRSAVGKLDVQLQTLRGLLQDRPEQLEQFDELERLARARVTALDRGIVLRRERGRDAAYEQVLSGVGKAIMDQLRTAIAGMMTDEAAALQTAVRMAHERTQRTQLLVGILFATLIALVAATVYLIWRYLKTREMLLAENRSVMARQQAVFDGAIDGIVTFNPSGSIESLNKSAERMFGYSADELARRDISKLIQIEDDEAAPFLTRIGATQGALSLGLVRELKARHRDGSVIPVDVAFGPMDLPTGTHIVAMVRDISGRRRVEQMKEDFISTVSHELRTPLTSIAGSLGLLAGGVAGQLPDQAARLIAIANVNCQRLVRLINNVLDIGKIEAGEFKLTLEPLDLRDVARRSIDSMKSFADNYGVKLVLANGPAAPVRGDTDRLIQVTTNLLANACKYSPKGASVRISVSRSGNLARFSVKDRGPGVPEEFRSRMFSKFSQAGGDSQAKGGSGLGLVIAREIADLHGGRLWFESKPGEGATFHFDLPLRTETPAKHDAPRLLLCEDDEEKALAISAVLARGGFSIDLAPSAEDALEFARRGGYAAAVVDLNLPGADSVDFIQSIRARPETRDLPVILLSAAAGAENFEGCPLVVVDWFKEPIDLGRLKAALDVCLKGSVSERPVVLHVDDDPDLLQVVASALGEEAAIVPAESLQAARAALARQRPDLVILDLGLTDGSGPDLLPDLTDRMGRAIPVIIYSAQEPSGELIHRVDAVLVKSRTSLDLLATTVQRLIAENEARHVAA